jgi:hypothetical protein
MPKSETFNLVHSCDFYTIRFDYDFEVFFYVNSYLAYAQHALKIILQLIQDAFKHY